MTRTPKSTWPIASARNNPVVSSSWWPLFDLTIRTPRLVMRPPRDEDVFAIVELASAGIHDPKEMPFRFPWTDVASPQFERNSLQFHWRVRATWTVEQWQLPFAVWVEGEISNCRPWNGHLYFTLKDASSQLRAFMFRSSLRYLKFKPADGLRVVARGKVSVNGKVLEAGDGAKITAESQLRLSDGQQAEVLVFDLA